VHVLFVHACVACVHVLRACIRVCVLCVFIYACVPMCVYKFV